MFEKGKGHYVENLRIIQLCEADLNFVLHVIWGHRLIRHATTRKALDAAQYALPGQTCHNAVPHKNLFLDLSCQTLTSGVMSDFDATAVFDWVLSSLSIVTCQRLGLPKAAGLFMHNLLSNMQFDLITGFGRSDISYRNNEDPTQIGQGVLQGSSSACPIFAVNSDVSLSMYRKLCYGASFQHPIMGAYIKTRGLQFVDDTTGFLNGSCTLTTLSENTQKQDTLIEKANHNAQLWSNLLWISGGHLQYGKCFYYALIPCVDFKGNTIAYSSIHSNHPLMISHQNTTQHSINPISATRPRRTLGVTLAPDGSGKAQFKDINFESPTTMSQDSLIITDIKGKVGSILLYH